MGAYRYIKENIQKAHALHDDRVKARLTEWRKEKGIVRVERPTNLAKARELGYKAKNGVIIARVKIRKGLSKRPKPIRGRKPSKTGRFYAYAKSAQAMAEERAARKFTNCEVLNSYFVGEDGNFKFYEAIMLDRTNPNVTKDKQLSNALNNRNRVYRGLTRAGKAHRGLLNKGFGSRNRPSVRSASRSL